MHTMPEHKSKADTSGSSNVIPPPAANLENNNAGYSAGEQNQSSEQSMANLDF
jgi:hypothetical protein